MTLELLQQYFGIVSNIEAIDDEINALYTPIQSPNGRESTGHSNTPSAPTERSAMRIIALKEQIGEERARMIELREEIETWLATCENAEISAIIRWRFIRRKNWREVNMKVYGYPDYNYARRKVIRFFDKENKHGERKSN
jgi:hypothetical protein